MIKKVALFLLALSYIANLSPSEARQRPEKLSDDTKKKIAERLKEIYGLPETPDISRLYFSGYASVNHTAEGVVILEESGELHLDITPCDVNFKKKQIQSYIAPYDEVYLHNIKCDSGADKLMIFKVTQKEERWK